MRSETRQRSHSTGLAGSPQADDRSLFIAATAALLEQARSTTGARGGRLCLRSHAGAETVTVERGRIRYEHLGESCEDCPALAVGDGEAADIELRCGRFAMLPILYGESHLGSLLLDAPQEAVEADWSGCRALAKDVAYEAMHAEVRRRLDGSVRRDLASFPASDSLRAIERFVERAAGTDLPVLLVGEASWELDYAPFALHFAGPRRDGPIVRVRCGALDPARFGEQIEEALLAAAGGSLLLQGIEDLDARQQMLLSEILEFRRPAAADRKAAGGARVVAAIHLDPQRFRAGEDVRGCLLEAVDYLRLEVAPLRRRRDEVRPLVEHFLRLHAGENGPRSLNDDAMAILEAHDWPGNLYELERCAARLALLGEGEVLDVEAVCRLLPRIVERVGRDGDEDRLVEFLLGRGGSAQRRSRWSADLHLLRLSDALLRRDLSNLGPCHPALRRALLHLAAHFREELSLTQLACQVHLSPSHLSALFARQLQTSFKRLLVVLRLRWMARLLEQDPALSVGKAAAAAGFPELRSCERSFRDYFGCSPSEYRRHAAASPTPPSS